MLLKPKTLKIMMTKKLLISLAFSMVFLPLFANPNESNPPKGGISGTIKENSTGTAMEYANVALYSAVDSTLISGTITDVEGNFILPDVGYGDYYLELNFIGFEKKTINDISLSKKQKQTSLGEIVLMPATEILADVSVVAEKSHISYQIDKKVINVGKDLSSAGGSAIQVLGKAPSIQVDAQGNAQLRGSSDFTVLVNGKPSLLKGNEALKQLPASGIEKIELITNPSAKYDPDGKSGIINVIMKSNSLDGFNGLMNASAATGDKYTANANVNYRKGKLNVFTGVDYNDNTFTTDLDFDRKLYVNDQASQQLISDGELGNMNGSLVYKGGFDLYFTDKTDLTVSGSIGERTFDNSSDSKYSLLNMSDDLSTYGKTHKYMDVYGEISEVYAGLTHKFDDGHDIVLSGQYESWNGYDAEDMEEQFTDATHTEHLGYGEKHRYNKDDLNYQFRLKADYQKKLNDKSKMEMGYQARIYSRDEEFRYENYEDGSFVPTPELNNDLLYERLIHSFYTTYSSELSGFSYQAGLRVESTDRNISISNEQDDYTYEKIDYFPSLHMSRNFEGDHSMQASYSRRVRRPNSWILNNNPRWFDQNNIFYGDPMLEPEYADSYELGYRKSFKKVSVNSQLYYRYTNNAFTTARYLADTVNNIIHHQQTNANNSKALGLEMGANMNLYKWLQINVGANVYNYDIEGEVGGESVDNSNITWDARFASTFILKKGYRFQLNGFYSARSVDLTGERNPFIVTNVSVAGTLKFKYETNSKMENTSYIINPESPTVAINLSYKFNNFSHKKRNVDGDNEYTGGGF